MDIHSREYLSLCFYLIENPVMVSSGQFSLLLFIDNFSFDALILIDLRDTNVS